jgi:hypothetical protein
VVEVYSKKREQQEYTSANISKFVNAIVFTCQEVMAAEKMNRQQEELREKKGKMTDLFKRIKCDCSTINTSLGFREESGDYDIEEAMWWLEYMTLAIDEFSAYKDLVSVWENDELTRSGSNYAWLSKYLEDTKTCLDEAIANDAIANDAIVKLIKAKGQGNQYDEVSIVDVCHDVPMEVDRDKPRDVARENCYNVPTSGGSPHNDGFRAIHARVGLPELGVYGEGDQAHEDQVVVEDHGLYDLGGVVGNCHDVPSGEENCDEDSALNKAEIEDSQGNVHIRDLEEEFVKQDAADELIDGSVKVDNDDKDILAR